MTTMTFLGVVAVFGAAALARLRASNARRTPMAVQRRSESGGRGRGAPR